MEADCVFFLNFVALNVNTKRHIASWLLLAVFVPMLLLSSLHIHETVQSELTSCAECVQHHCGGHLGQQAIALHACVLCQFLTLPMLAVAVATLLIFNNVCKAAPVTWRRSVCVAHLSMVGLRGPPAV